MQAVIDFLKQNETRFLSELFEYVRFPSVSAQPQHRDDLRACAAWLREHCERIGLQTRVCETQGYPIVLAKTPRPASGSPRRRPHFLVYGHYDVQPPEPFELWKSPPFEPRVEGRSLFARGASDNKGQNLAHLNAVEAYLKTGTELPCDLTFVIEGEEEVGSKSLASLSEGTSRRVEVRCRRHFRHGHAGQKISGADLCLARHRRVSKLRCADRRAICIPEFSAARWIIRPWP